MSVKPDRNVGKECQGTAAAAGKEEREKSQPAALLILKSLKERRRVRPVSAG